MTALKGDWVPLHLPELTTLPRAVVLRSQCLPTRHVFPLHRHTWNQFVYATAGTLVVTVGDTWHVITPEQAIWVPSGVAHATGALHGAEFRNLYVADGPGVTMPDHCTVLSVSPLLRALILELVEIADRPEDPAYRDRVDALILDQLHRLKRLDMHLPWPRSHDLRTVCEALYSRPDDERTLEHWGATVGASPRTLLRRFEKEVGMSLRAWRHRLRLFRAVEWLTSGRPVTEVALDLGYASPSAFTFMFRSAMGCSPTDWLARSRPGAGTGASEARRRAR